MLSIVYSGPCKDKPSTIGYSELVLQYEGSTPVAEVMRAISRIPGARVDCAVYNDRIVIDEGYDVYGRRLN